MLLRILLACATLYAASYLFLMAPGLVAMVTVPAQAAHVVTLSAVVFGTAFGAFYALIFTGAFVTLVPLAYANHLLIAKARNRERLTLAWLNP